MTERAWWHSYYIDPILMALALYSISGDGQEGDRLMTHCMAGTQMLKGQS